jgi:hypothetical protein
VVTMGRRVDAAVISWSYLKRAELRLEVPLEIVAY